MEITVDFFEELPIIDETKQKRTRVWRGHNSLVLPFSAQEIPRWILMQADRIEPTDDPTNCHLIYDVIDGCIWEIRTLVAVENKTRDAIFYRWGSGLKRGRKLSVSHNIKRWDA